MPPRKKAKKLPDWQEIVREAHEIRDRSIAEVDDAVQFQTPLPSNVLSAPDIFLSKTELDITSESPKALIRLVKSRELSAQETVKAFLLRAVVAQKTTNCVAELLPARARAHTADLDKSKSHGALHGLPVSIKSHIGLKGCHTPAGYISRWSNVPESDALVAQILARAGAVIMARTTEPQTMMQLETASNLYGTTVNPFNTALSAGGSSGGEAALVAMGGSVIGVGSDVGGSIRVPAAACGIFGLKPTAFRVPTTGYGSIPAGADYVQTVLGPLCRTLEGIELFMQTVLDAEPWKLEPALVPLPWRSVDVRPTPARPLRLGVMWHDGVVLPHPPISRALTEFVERVKKLAHVEVVDFEAYKHDEAWAITSSLYFSDGGKADIAALEASGEPWLPLTKWIVETNPCVEELDRNSLEYWLEEKEEYRLEYAKAWNASGVWNAETGRWERTVDALICPVAPGVTTRPGTAKYWYYTSTWNLLDYPAMAFPAGKADKRLDVRVARTTYMSDLDRENWALYDPETFHGMPVGLQLVGRRFEDEKVVGILQALQAPTT